MNKLTVLGTICSILVNPSNGLWDFCLVKMVWRTAAVPKIETVCYTTTWIWSQSGSLLFGHCGGRQLSQGLCVLCTTVWIWLQSGGLLFGYYDSNDGSSPRDCVVHHYMNMATVLGNIVWSRYFKRHQQPQRPCVATIWIMLQSWGLYVEFSQTQ